MKEKTHREKSVKQEKSMLSMAADKRVKGTFLNRRDEAEHFIVLKRDKAGFKVGHVNSIIGKGVFATKDFKRGEFLLEYKGELIPKSEGMRREKIYPLKLGSFLYYFQNMGEKMCIDATFSKAKGRYVNDAVGAEKNCMMLLQTVNGKPHICLFATKSIAKGTELRYNYGVPNLPWRRKHMKNYRILMQRVSSWLKPAGLLFIQILCHRLYPYAFDSKPGSDTEWMAKNFFTGGTMPSSDLFLYFQDDVSLVDQWIWNGKHYTKTLEAWLQKTDLNIDSIKTVFTEAYGDDSNKQIFNWRLFFIFCSEVFGYSDGNEWHIAQYLLKKKSKSSL